MHPGNKGGDKSLSPQSRQMSPQEMLWESQAEIWDTDADQLLRSNVLLCQHRTSRLLCKGWAPKTKESLLIYPCKQSIYGYIQSYRLLYPSVTFPSPVPCNPLHIPIPQVLSLCYAIPTSLLLYQNSGLDCFLLILLPATRPSSITGFPPSTLPSSYLTIKNLLLYFTQLYVILSFFVSSQDINSI
jgi:hypothetical protein